MTFHWLYALIFIYKALQIFLWGTPLLFCVVQVTTVVVYVDLLPIIHIKGLLLIYFCVHVF